MDEWVGVAMFVIIFGTIFLGASCDQSNRQRTAQRRYECIKEGHPAEVCKDIFK